MPTSPIQTQPRLYFAYGSNMWKEQMMLRCPNSLYKGVGRLINYRWIINERGYANVVSSRNPDDEVYGLVYDLTTSSDEDRLDRNEDVPFSYTKEGIAIDFWESTDIVAVGISSKGVEKHALVYVDRQRVVADQPHEEYIYRMNMGIRDAVDGAGVPLTYVQKVIRPFIPEEAKNVMGELARKQAMNFQEGRKSS